MELADDNGELSKIVVSTTMNDKSISTDSLNATYTPYIVGIAGGTGSGKSTFAKALTEAIHMRDAALTVEMIGTDRYFREDKTQEPQFFFKHHGQSMFNWNHPNAIDNARLLADLDARCAAADAPDIIVLEGLMVLHEPTVREHCHLRLFVELDADERALRRMLRNMKVQAVSTDPNFIAAYYLESARVGHARYIEPSRVYADLIVRGDADFARIAPIVAATYFGLRA